MKQLHTLQQNIGQDKDMHNLNFDITQLFYQLQVQAYVTENFAK